MIYIYIYIYTRELWMNADTLFFFLIKFFFGVFFSSLWALAAR